jgi:hypothetical protein
LGKALLTNITTIRSLSRVLSHVNPAQITSLMMLNSEIFTHALLVTELINKILFSIFPLPSPYRNDIFPSRAGCQLFADNILFLPFLSYLNKFYLFTIPFSLISVFPAFFFHTFPFFPLLRFYNFFTQDASADIPLRRVRGNSKYRPLP